MECRKHLHIIFFGVCNILVMYSYETLLYRKLCIFKLTDINKYLIGRFMFRFCNGHVPEIFNSFIFAYKYEFHNYNARSAQYFHIPPVKTNLGKTGIRYGGTLTCNEMLNKGIYPDTSECLFVKFLQTCAMSI